MLLRSTISLFRKDLLIEFRNKYVIGGIVLYVLSSVMVIYFSLTHDGPETYPMESKGGAFEHGWPAASYLGHLAA